MKFIETKLKNAFLANLDPKRDNRGVFTRIFCQTEFRAIGFDGEIKQTNHSYTKKKGTLRGMHYQIPPSAEVKIIRVIKGTIYDVIVDLRKDSSTYLSWTTVTLSEDKPQLLYIPEGFAHGFQTLSDDVEMIYQHSSHHSQEHERGFRFDDSKIKISWPLPISIMSKKDQEYPSFNL